MPGADPGPKRGELSGIETWIFDLDNTLYPADCHLFAQIDARMASFIETRLVCDPQRARFLQKDWYRRHGTTLAGLMIEHDVPPEDFLDYVHDIDLSPVVANAPLRAAIAALPGQRYVFTNGSVRHAENVTAKLGITDLFHGMHDIAGCGYVPKPKPEAYDRFARRFDFDPGTAAFFEDMPQNLEVPHALGMTTVLVQSAAEWFADEPAGKRPSRPGERFDHVDHVTDDLTSFLAGLTSATPARASGVADDLPHQRKARST